ncbi:hypothetical protein IMG5_018490, partial [Ichthyophthirius multifiliis]
QNKNILYTDIKKIYKNNKINDYQINVLNNKKQKNDILNKYKNNYFVQKNQDLFYKKNYIQIFLHSQSFSIYQVINQTLTSIVIVFQDEFNSVLFSFRLLREPPQNYIGLSSESLGLFIFSQISQTFFTPITFYFRFSKSKFTFFWHHQLLRLVVFLQQILFIYHQEKIQQNQRHQIHFQQHHQSLFQLFMNQKILLKSNFQLYILQKLFHFIKFIH